MLNVQVHHEAECDTAAGFDIHLTVFIEDGVCKAHSDSCQHIGEFFSVFIRNAAVFREAEILDGICTLFGEHQIVICCAARVCVSFNDDLFDEIFVGSAEDYGSINGQETAKELITGIGDIRFILGKKDQRIQ